MKQKYTVSYLAQLEASESFNEGRFIVQYSFHNYRLDALLDILVKESNALVSSHLDWIIEDSKGKCFHSLYKKLLFK